MDQAFEVRFGLLVGEVEDKASRYSTPYYPQANGAMEKVNGILVKNIQKRVKDKARMWINILMMLFGRTTFLISPP